MPAGLTCDINVIGCQLSVFGSPRPAGGSFPHPAQICRDFTPGPLLPIANCRLLSTYPMPSRFAGLSHFVRQLAPCRQASILAYFACFSMNSLLGGTSSPISIEKIWSASAALSMFTWRSVRVSGFIVVDHSCSAFISPRPL